MTAKVRSMDVSFTPIDGTEEIEEINKNARVKHRWTFSDKSSITIETSGYVRTCIVFLYDAAGNKTMQICTSQCDEPNETVYEHLSQIKQKNLSIETVLAIGIDIVVSIMEHMPHHRCMEPLHIQVPATILRKKQLSQGFYIISMRVHTTMRMRANTMSIYTATLDASEVYDPLNLPELY